MTLMQDEHGRYHAQGAVSAEDILTAAANIITERSIGKPMDALSDPQAAGRLFKARLQHLEHEEFHVAYLDTHYRVLAVEMLFRGTVDSTEVHPREVARNALKHNAAAVCVAHGHPSGNPEPSAADRAVTARLKQSLALLDIRLLDHLVVGDGTPVSLAARGWV